MTVINADIVKYLEEYKGEDFDLIIADPPYGLDYGEDFSSYNRSNDLLVGGYIEAPEQFDQWCYQWLQRMYAHAKTNAACYVIINWNNVHTVISEGIEAGWEYAGHLIWKYQFGVYCNKKFVTSHYHIIYFKKGEPPFNEGGYCEDVLIINKEYKAGDIRYPNMLPESLIEMLICKSSNPNSLVLDAFAGSGTTGILSKVFGRRSISVDANYEAYKYILGREAMGCLR